MSVDKNVYTILGYDLQEHRDVILSDEFYDSERYDELTCNQVKGEIQLFTDPMSGDHLFLGYIVGAITSDYGDNVYTSNPWDWEEFKCRVDEVLYEVYPYRGICIPQYITFAEYR
ncbi:hypothetical protein [Anaerosporobacter sp.]